MEEEIEVTIKMRTGRMFMRLAPMGEVKQDDGEVVGEITGGTLEVKIEGKTYSATSKEIWNAVAEKFGHEEWKFVE